MYFGSKRRKIVPTQLGYRMWCWAEEEALDLREGMSPHQTHEYQEGGRSRQVLVLWAADREGCSIIKAGAAVCCSGISFNSFSPRATV